MNPEKHAAGNGCAEYNTLTRRSLLRGAATAGLALAMPAWLPRVVLAEDGPPRDVLVSVYLRGGADGLTLCAPHGEASYYTLRPNIAIPRPNSGSPHAAINLDGFFGFPRALASLVPAYSAGHLLVVHATGSTDPSRSHFDAQRYMEVGTPSDPSLYVGWLSRHLASIAPLRSGAPLRALAVSSGLPLTLNAAPRTLPIPSPDWFVREGRWETADARATALNTTYASAGEPLRSAALNTDATIALLDGVGISGYTPQGGAVYPTDSYFSFGLKCAAALIKAQVGVEAIHLDLGGWDTHNAQGPLDGWMNTLMREFADSLAAFYKDIMAGTVQDVTTVAVSEFGRNVAQNASGGTDHGHGNALFLLGKNVRGGRVMRNWPGLSAAQQYEGQDLQVTIDYRDILAEVVRKRLANANAASVFPGYTPTFRGAVA